VSDTQELLPIKKGDNFMVGPYHFVCMGWKDGRILAMRYETGPYEQRGIYKHSLSIDVALSPGFRMLEQQGGQLPR